MELGLLIWRIMQISAVLMEMNRIKIANAISRRDNGAKIISMSFRKDFSEKKRLLAVKYAASKEVITAAEMMQNII